jgi:hypothetical protein
LPQSPQSNPDRANLVLLAAFTGAALACLSLFQPADWLICPFRWLTGLLCPLCGMTHALCALGHGHIREALRLHALSPLVYVLFAAGFVKSCLGLAGLRFEPVAMPQWFGARLLATLLIAYGAVRIALKVFG